MNMPDISYKSFRMKAVDSKGHVTAAVGRMGVIDHNGDLPMPGFLQRQDTRMLFAHNGFNLNLMGAISTDVPIGKGILFEEPDANELQFEGRFNLEIPKAREVHSNLIFDQENGVPLQEWSYGSRPLEGGFSFQEIDGRMVTVLHEREDGSPGVKALEVSPTLLDAAGIDTRTLVVKSQSGNMRFAEEAEAVRAAVDAFAGRAQSLADTRSEDGRQLSAKARENITEFLDGINDAAIRMKALLVEPTQEPVSVDASQDWLTYQKTLAMLNGVEI